MGGRPIFPFYIIGCLIKSKKFPGDGHAGGPWEDIDGIKGRDLDWECLKISMCSPGLSGFGCALEEAANEEASVTCDIHIWIVVSFC